MKSDLVSCDTWSQIKLQQKAINKVEAKMTVKGEDMKKSIESWQLSNK